MQIAQKIHSSLLLWICVLVLHFPFGQGSVTCRKDSDCLKPGTYCLDGYCDGYCIPCEEFLRKPPSSGGCAKDELDCGTCIPGAAPEELEGMRFSFRCEKFEIFTPEIPQLFTNSVLLISLPAVALVFTGFIICIKRKGELLGQEDMSRTEISMEPSTTLSTSDGIDEFLSFRIGLFGTPLSTSENVTEVNVEKDLPQNLDWPNEDETRQLLMSDLRPNEDETRQLLMSDVRPNEDRPLERMNNVRAQPMNDPFGTNSEGNRDPSAAPLLSEISSNPEGSANNEESHSMYEGVIIELSNYRNETTNRGNNHDELLAEVARNQTELSIESSTTFPTSDDRSTATSENVERDPPYNPYWREEDEINQLLNSKVQPNAELPLEWVQNVQPQPMNVTFDTNLGENLDPPAPTLPSGVPSNSEGSASDGVLLGGMHESETIELFNYRNKTKNREDNYGELLREEAKDQTELTIEPSTTDDARIVMEMEPDGSDNESG